MVFHRQIRQLFSIGLFLFLVLSLSVNAQFTPNSFRHLTTNEGLPDGSVHAIVQDKYGFIWIGTSYGLSRFDGIAVIPFFHQEGDANSLSDNYISALFCDRKGRLWIGTLNGLCRYEYGTACMVRYRSAKPVTITDVQEDKKGAIWLATTDGLWVVDELTQSTVKFSGRNDIAFTNEFKGAIRQMVVAADGNFYLATSRGIKTFNPATFSFTQMRHDAANQTTIGSDTVLSLALDTSGALWASYTSAEGALQKINPATGLVVSSFTFPPYKTEDKANYITKILVDEKNRIWLASTTNGLTRCNKAGKTEASYRYDALIPNTVLANHHDVLYKDKEGLIWLGTQGYGVSYFHPDKNFFHTLHPSEDKENSLPHVWCRAACEDQEGNLWLGTGKGVARYNRQRQRFTLYANTETSHPPLYYNSIRSLLTDDEGHIWIGTSKGLNRYHPHTRKMDFFGTAQGLPLSFIWMMAKRRGNEVWIGARDGLYRYQPLQNHFDDVSNDPILSSIAKKNIQALFTDTKNRLWIGILNLGVVMYDGRNRLLQLTKQNGLLSDDRVSSFAEDKEGVIWIGSEEGLTAYHPQTNTASFFNHQNGLPSNRTNNIMCDKSDRIWIGTSNGLCVLDKDRKMLKRFDANDGLLTNQFNEQSAYETRDGYFVYPTYKGFLIFRPDDYKGDRTDLPLYITSFRISGAEQSIMPNPQDLGQVHLQYNENFFTIGLAGLNYLNPQQCIYAYRLEPFDKDWVYTTNREIKYTNVPAGRYTFHYKASTNASAWGTAEKTLPIKIDAVFYATFWFRLLMAALTAAILYAVYQYRTSQKEKFTALQTKATALEREKAVVMYESLKQQLNPHFLFNSLSSLSGLIQKDQGAAKIFLDQLSKIYRYILKSGDSEVVRISEDLKLAQIYVQLQQTRFGTGLQIKVAIGDDDLSKRIAPVTIQNLIENAIKHNIIDAESPLVISVTVAENYLVVQNNLQKKSFVEGSNKQGLQNMKTLYRYLCGKAVITEETPETFTVKIPFV